MRKLTFLIFFIICLAVLGSVSFFNRVTIFDNFRNKITGVDCTPAQNENTKVEQQEKNYSLLPSNSWNAKMPIW